MSFAVKAAASLCVSTALNLDSLAVRVSAATLNSCRLSIKSERSVSLVCKGVISIWKGGISASFISSIVTPFDHLNLT